MFELDPLYCRWKSEPVIVTLGCCFLLGGWERVCVFIWEQDYRNGVGQESDVRGGSLDDRTSGRHMIGIGSEVGGVWGGCNADSNFVFFGSAMLTPHLAPTHQAVSHLAGPQFVYVCVRLSESACVIISIAIHEAIAWPAVIQTPTLTVL